MGRYEEYNERLFEAYCKTAINHAISSARREKAAHGKRVRSLSDLSEADLFALGEKPEVNLPENGVTLYVRDQAFQIKNQKLGQALYSLLPREREIILLYYVSGLNDGIIAERMNLSRAAIGRRRHAALKKLQTILKMIP